jgi:hypothetical protein
LADGAREKLTREQREAGVAELRILRLRTSDGVLLFPAFQVHEGTLMRGLAKVLTELRDGFGSPWMWAQWLLATPPGGTQSHIEALRAGDIEGVALAARHTAWAWTWKQ